MALFLPGPAIAEARGSVGGTTFSRNRNGAYMRVRVSPVQPRTQAQELIRLHMTTCQAAWRDTLTAAERAAWEACASQTLRTNKIGASNPMTGINAFLASNLLRLQASAAILTAAPAGPLSAVAPTITVQQAVADKDLEMAAPSPVIAANEYLFVYLSGNQSRTKNFFRGPWADRLVLNSATVFPLQLRAVTALEDVSRVHYAWRFMDADGRMSPLVVESIDIATT